MIRSSTQLKALIRNRAGGDSGLRVSVEAYLNMTKIPMKIDISTGDAITPGAADYEFKLMFEDRSINLWAYPIETVLAEKIETILTRASLNTRMRDYYDLYILRETGQPYDTDTLKNAISATSRKRESAEKLSRWREAVNEIENSPAMASQWGNYRSKNSYVGDISWETALSSVKKFCEVIFDQQYES